MYSLEAHPSGKARRFQLVDLTDNRTFPLAADGWAEDLIRGDDGALYFRFFRAWQCSIYKVVSGDFPKNIAPCPWRNGAGIAVGPGETLWQGAFLGVDQYGPDGRTIKHIGPIETPPCMIKQRSARAGIHHFGRARRCVLLVRAETVAR